MKRVVIYLVLLSFGALSFSACFHDEGNYQYNTLPEFYVDTTGVATTRTLAQYSTLTIPANLKYAGDKSSLTYSWAIYTTANDVLADTLSTSENFSAQITVSPGSYVLEFCALERVSGVRATMRYNLTVEGIIGTGLLVYHGGSGTGDCDIIKSTLFVGSQVEESVVRGLYSQANPGRPLQGSPLACKQLNASALRTIYLFTDAEGVKLSPDDLSIMQDYTDMFLTSPEVWQPQGYYAHNTSLEMLVNNGALHTCLPGYSGGFPQFAFPRVGDYEAAPYPLMAYGANVFVYDQKNGRFLYGGMYSGELIPVTSTNGVFSFTNTNMKMLYMSLGYGVGANAQGYMAYAVMKNVVDNGERYIYVADISFSSHSAYIAKAKLDISACMDIEKAELFAYGRRGPVVFYAVDGDIHQIHYDLDLGSVSGSSVVWSFPAGEKVTCMEMFYGAGIDLAVSPDSKYLLVGTYNETTQAGKVYVLEADVASGMLQPEPAAVYDGFGKVMDMEFKSI
jgi:hypothetical protein